MRAFLTIALGALLLLVTFADEVFAQRRGGGRAGVGRAHIGRVGVGARYVGRGIAYRGLAYRGVRYGYRPLARRAVIGAGLVGLGVGYGYYGGYYGGYYDGYYGDSCVASRLVWNGWAYQRVLVNIC